MKKIAILISSILLMLAFIAGTSAFGGSGGYTTNFWKLTGTVLSPADDGNSLSVGDMVVTGNVTGALDMNGEIITNIGNAGTDFDSNGGLTLAENLSLKDNNKLFFDTAEAVSIEYSPSHGSLLINNTNDSNKCIISAIGNLELYPNTGADGSGTWEPQFYLDHDGYALLKNTTQGAAGKKYFSIEMTDGIQFKSGGSNIQAIIKADNIATAAKTFQFPNNSGTFALEAGNIATATALETARTIAGVSFDGSANINLASTGLSDTADLLYEEELNTFSELQTQIADETLLKAGTLTDTKYCIYDSASTDIICNSTIAGGGDLKADGSVPMTADFNLDGNNLDNIGVMFLKEQADADADIAGQGQIWVNTATPNELWWTDDAGTDVQLGLGGGTVDTSGTPVDNDFAKFTDANTIEGRSYTEVRGDLGIEAGATADQTGAEIKTAYEAEADTNAFTDAEKTLLGNQSGVNTGDQDLSGKANVDQTMYIGTTAVAINRASAALTLAGLTLTIPDIGTPSAGTLTNCSFPTLNQNTTGSAATLTNVRTIGGVNFDGSANIVPNTITIADESADTSCYVGYFTAATGGLQPKTGTNLAFNSNTGILTATGFTGNVTGDCTGSSGSCTGEAATVATIAGLAPNTATTQATQGAITSLGTLTGLTMSGAIQLGETSIKLDATLSADAKWSGITTSGTSGVTTLAIGDLIYLNANDSRWELVDANLSDGYDKQLGIALTAAADGAALEVLVFGKVRSATFPAFTVGSPLYMSETAGDVTHTVPTTADVCVRALGYSLTAEDFFFNPSQDYLIHN